MQIQRRKKENTAPVEESSMSNLKVTTVNRALLTRTATIPNTYHAFIMHAINAYKNQLDELGSLFDLAGWQSSVSKHMPPALKKIIYQFQHSNQYPPFLRFVPLDDNRNIFQIFDRTTLLQTLEISLPQFLIPQSIVELAPNALKDRTMQSLVNRNRQLHSDKHNLYFRRNVGDRDDWYTDVVFAQQRFTGDNPTTIEVASETWFDRFKDVAHIQRRADILSLLTSSPPNSFFILDYSYFRPVLRLSPDSDLTCDGRYGCASVTLFHLGNNGKLHPLAITIDYKGSMKNSVTIFNRRVSPQSPIPEANDWPWRYAKMCVQVSDWTWHEVAVHLVHTHFLEEAIIVAAHRTLHPPHVVFKLLEPHWNITLSLNQLARSMLVPGAIVKITGFTPAQIHALIKASYHKSNWKSGYVPNDLRQRGFPIAELDTPKFHNYGYARNVLRMWNILRKFVSTVLRGSYTGGDSQVARDPDVAAFCAEMRSSSGAQLPSFPDAKTLDDLIDIVTMCIHIASSQHTAVNYLQQYYQTFVPNKPSALYTSLPRTLNDLQNITEEDVIKALPVDRPTQWLLQAQVVYLLSFRAAGDQTILRYAEDAAWMYWEDPIICRAAAVLKDDLEEFVNVVETLSGQLDDQNTPYLVLDPRMTASSIII